MRRLVAGVALVVLVAMAAGPSGESGPRFASPALLAGGSELGPRPAEALAAQRWLQQLQGNLPPSVAWRAAWTAAAQAKKMPRASGSLAGRWRELGPKPYREDDLAYNDPYNGGPPTGWTSVSGRVAALAVDPNDRSGKTVWVGTAGGGLWVTRDEGEHFASAWDQMPSLAIGAIAFDATRTKTMYVGTGEGNLFGAQAGTGVYRSVDDGRTFARTDRNVAASVVTHIEARGGIVLAATDQGLWRSADGGSSYVDAHLPTNAAGAAPSKLPFGSFVSDVRIHPDRPSEVTAAVGLPDGKAGSEGNGLYRSTKGGAPGTWRRLDSSGLTTASVTDDPLGRISLAYATGPGQNHDILWAIVEDAGLWNGQLKEGAPSPIFSSLNGVYRSGDDGATWTAKATPASLDSAPGSGLVGEVALYSPGIQSAYNQWVAVSPANPDVVLIGLEEIYETIANANGPGEAQWQTIGRYWNMCAYPVNVGCDAVPVGPWAGTTVHGDQHALAFTDGGKTIFAGNDGGVFVNRSATGVFANDWTSVNGTLGTTQAYHAAMGSDGTVYAGFQDNGIGKITPDGEGVNTFVGDGGDVAIDPRDSDHAFSEYVAGHIFKTTDGGRNWTSIAPDFGRAAFIAPISMDPSNPDHVAVAGDSVMETTKGTDTVCTNDFLVSGEHAGPCDWMSSYSFPDGAVGQATDMVRDRIYASFCKVCQPWIDANRADAASNVSYGIATNNQAQCSPAPGKADCWHVVRAKGLPNRLPSGVAIDRNRTATLYVTLAGYGQYWVPLDSHQKNIGRGHVFVSDNSGDSFRDISTNLPDTPVYSIVAKGSRLFVGTALGVFTAAKAGARWERVGGGLPNAAAFSVRLNPQETELVVATYGRGVWALKIGK